MMKVGSQSKKRRCEEEEDDIAAVYFESHPTTIPCTDSESANTSSFKPTLVRQSVSTRVAEVLDELVLKIRSFFPCTVSVIHNIADPHWLWGLHHGSFEKLLQHDTAGWEELSLAKTGKRHTLKWLQSSHGYSYGGAHHTGRDPLILTKPAWATPTHVRKGVSSSPGLGCLCGACLKCRPILELIYLPDLRGLYPADSAERQSIRSLERALRSWASFKAYNLTPTRAKQHTAGWMLANYRNVSAHAAKVRHFHEYTAWHTCDQANGTLHVAQATSKRPRRIRPCRSQDGQAGTAGWPALARPMQLVAEGIILPLPPFLLRARDLFVPRSMWGTARPGFDIFGTGYSYVAFNIFCDSSLSGDAPAVAFDLGGDKFSVASSGASVGLSHHWDANNTKNAMGCIFVLGEWEGFGQSYPTFGVTLNAQPWSVMWGDYSELLHAVQQGSGFRLSFILVSHESISHGWRPSDGSKVDFSLAHDPRSEIDQNWAWTAASIAELISARAALELASSS